jgi:hypothetical protein
MARCVTQEHKAALAEYQAAFDAVHYGDESEAAMQRLNRAREAILIHERA